MVNSIEEIDYYLELGANGIEADVVFAANGTVLRLHHGVPCDCFRRCYQSAVFTDYLDHVRNLRSSRGRGFIMLMLDLKLENFEMSLEAQRFAGRDLFSKLVDHLWHDVPATERLHVLLSIPSVRRRYFFGGLLEEMSAEKKEDYRNQIAFDVGMNGAPHEIESMYTSLGISERIWQGDGISNCFIQMRPDRRLREVLALRDEPKGYVHKVYYWTADMTTTIEHGLAMGVDAFITNHPERVNRLVSANSRMYRLANGSDVPWEKIISKSTPGDPSGYLQMWSDTWSNISDMASQAGVYVSKFFMLGR
ncbi:phospholipase D SpeSicTox-betaIB4-like [Galendromus occidentalis]|uniref:Phospholipase D SpeSicTox-betaIB4-like n=1 Tax=Galendromus occidentalis TaxID=34638 RepID=A0AAJ7P9G5_9ACAR|nr:phospholipase D SpeSicTox-betaIB4-like [Galendromus occidentalis]